MTKKKFWDNSSLQQEIVWSNIQLPGITDEELYSKNWNRGVAIRGRKRPDQSARVSGDNNPMAGKVHPSKGKTMPQISDKVRGKKKSDGHGANVSKAKKGIPSDRKGIPRPTHSALMKDNNPMFRPIKTPHGEFQSIRFVIQDEKARGTKNADRRIRSWLNTPGSGYEYIDK
jgi:hypothetical protein